jgi:hypothetical protein
MRYVIHDYEAGLEAPLGGKARALASLREANLPIPAWFVVGPAAFNDSLTPEQRSALDRATDGAALRAVAAEL